MGKASHAMKIELSLKVYAEFVTKRFYLLLNLKCVEQVKYTTLE